MIDDVKYWINDSGRLHSGKILGEFQLNLEIPEENSASVWATLNDFDPGIRFIYDEFQCKSISIVTGARLIPTDQLGDTKEAAFEQFVARKAAAVGIKYAVS